MCGYIVDENYGANFMSYWSYHLIATVTFYSLICSIVYIPKMCGYILDENYGANFMSSGEGIASGRKRCTSRWMEGCWYWDFEFLSVTYCQACYILGNILSQYKICLPLEYNGLIV